MSYRNLNLIRRLSTSSALKKPTLSASYKSRSLWEERFNCQLLGGDEEMIKTINNKIIRDVELDSLEMDIFVNITPPRHDDIIQLQETVKLLARHRKSLAAINLLPSTSHATCRLFLYSNQYRSCVSLLENRVKYGIFPDFMAHNLLLDAAIEKDDYLSGARLAALVMLQEEFGLNQITDFLSLFATVKYIESKTNFKDWVRITNDKDPVLDDGEEASNASLKEEDSNKVDEQPAEEEGDDDEEDAQYVRVPWLRNPYFDGHFDEKNPRIICGKTLTAIAKTYALNNKELSLKASLLGDVLQGKWNAATETIKKCTREKLEFGDLKEILDFYISNLHDVDQPDDSTRETMLASVNAISSGKGSLSRFLEQKWQFKEVEEQDIAKMEDNLIKWSERRHNVLNRRREIAERKRLVEEIRSKKEQLKRKEQYLYFYDNLKKSNLTRIDYK